MNVTYPPNTKQFNRDHQENFNRIQVQANRPDDSITIYSTAEMVGKILSTTETDGK